MGKDIYAQNYTNYQSQRSSIRKVIRGFYFKNILKKIKGKTIDFGCGVGEFLTLLPKGSMGFEINKESVLLCNNKGLNVIEYMPEKDNYELKNIKPNEFESFVSMHVFEHIVDSQSALKKILNTCYKLNIQNVVIVVPGRKGYDWHKDFHFTFIDTDYLIQNNLDTNEYYELSTTTYFPIPFKWGGNYFTHNETVFFFQKRKS